MDDRPELLRSAYIVVLPTDNEKPLTNNNNILVEEPSPKMDENGNDETADNENDNYVPSRQEQPQTEHENELQEPEKEIEPN